jgi:hypothetical protein
MTSLDRDFSSAKLNEQLALNHLFFVYFCKHYTMQRDSQANNYSTYYDNIDQILKDLEISFNLSKPSMTNDSHQRF